jgi:hypothetical protein
MPKLIFYDSEGKIARVLSSSLPKEEWDIEIYGLEPGESKVLLEESEVPADFSQQAYLYDEGNQALIPNPDYIEPEPPRDYGAEIDEIKVRVEKLEKK